MAKQCKVCGKEIPEYKVYCDECRPKLGFNFENKPVEDQAESKYKSKSFLDNVNIPTTNEAEQTEDSAEIIENIETQEETERKRIELEKELEAQRIEEENKKALDDLLSKINYKEDKPEEELVQVSLPGTYEKQKPKFDWDFSFKKPNFKEMFKIEPITLNKSDLITSIASIGFIILLVVIIFISTFYVYNNYIKKETFTTNSDEIQVYVDEETLYYHYKDCHHIQKNMRYVKLEEKIAMELGYKKCTSD